MDLSFTERPQFLRHRARPLVPVRPRTCVEQHCTEMTCAWRPCAPTEPAIRNRAKPIPDVHVFHHACDAVALSARTARSLPGFRRDGDLLRHAAGDAACSGVD